MEKLQSTVEIRGTGIPELTATCIERTDKKALYERWDGVFEVFYIQNKQETEAFGKKFPETELYPCNEDFGKTAWTYISYEKAHGRYIKL